MKFRNCESYRNCYIWCKQNFWNSFQSFCAFLWDAHSLKNNSGVRRSSGLFEMVKNLPWHKLSFFLKLKLRVWNISKRMFAIKVYVEIPSLLPSIMGRSMASTIPMQRYSPHKEVQCIPKLILKVCMISINALNYICIF